MQNSKVKVTLIGGYDYATGSYGQPADTTIRSTPVTIKLDSLEWVAKFQTSYIRIRQTPKPPPTGGTPSEFRRFQSEGIGDTTISLAKKSWFRWGGINFFNTGVKVKLATASREKQLGTGEEDWMIELDGYRSSGKWLPFATIGYRWYGDTEETPREDGVYGSLGIHYTHNSEWSFGGLLDYRSANSVRFEDGQEFIPYLQYRINPRWSATLYGVAGLSDSSADSGIGLQLVYR